MLTPNLRLLYRHWALMLHQRPRLMEDQVSTPPTLTQQHTRPVQQLSVSVQQVPMRCMSTTKTMVLVFRPALQLMAVQTRNLAVMQAPLDPMLLALMLAPMA